MKKQKKKKAPQCIVVDLGSCSLKVGFSGIKTTASWAPNCSIATTTLPTPNRATMKGEAARQQWERRDELIRPVQQGKITDMEQLKLLLTHAFNDRMDATTKNCHILFADAPGHGKMNRTDREDLLAWTFERLEMQSCMFIPQPILAAFATGRTSAIVVDAGFESSSVTRVVNGEMERSQVHHVNYASQESVMLEMLIKNEKISTNGEVGGGPPLHEIGPHTRLICEGTCYLYCGLDINKERSSAKAGRCKKKYQLPDGTWLSVAEERFLIPEVMFATDFGNRWQSLGQGGLGGAVANLLKQSSDRDTYLDLANNIVCVGGRTETEHFDKRLDIEIAKGLGLKPRPKQTLEDSVSSRESEGEEGETKEGTKVDMRPKLPQNKARNKKKPRKYATWAGGAMVSSLNAMRSMWITKQEFEELGGDVCIDRRRLS